jgi:cell division protein FtsB
MLGNLFAPLAMKVTGGIAALLLVLLGIQTWRLSSAQDALEDKRNELAASEAQHAVTRASLATLEGELAKMVRDGELRAQRLAEARSEAKEASDALRGRAEALRAQAGSVGDPCVTPDAVKGAKGL